MMSSLQLCGYVGVFRADLVRVGLTALLKFLGEFGLADGEYLGRK